MFKKPAASASRVETIRTWLDSEDDNLLSVLYFETVLTYLKETLDLNQAKRDAGDPLEILPSESLLNDLVKQFGNVEVIEDSEIKLLVLEWLVSSDCSEVLLSILQHDNFDIRYQALNVLSDFADSEDNYSGFFLALVRKGLPQILIDLITHKVPTDVTATDVREFEEKALYLLVGIIPETDENPEATTFEYSQQDQLLAFVSGKTFDARLENPLNITLSVQYCSELLMKLVLGSAEPDSLVKKLLSHLEGDLIESLLNSVFQTRKPELKPSSNTPHEEYSENLFNCLCGLVLRSSDCKKAFIQAEGSDLVVLVFKYYTSKESYLEKDNFDYSGWEKANRWVFARGFRLIRSLTEAEKESDEEEAYNCCVNLIEAGILKYLFKPLTLLNKKLLLTILFPFNQSQVLERTSTFVLCFLGIMNAFFARLQPGLPTRLRFVNKLMDKNCAALRRIQDIRLFFTYQEFGEEIVRMCDLTTLWLSAELDSVKAEVIKVLQEKGMGLAQIKDSLSQYSSTLGDSYQEALLKDIIGELV